MAQTTETADSVLEFWFGRGRGDAEAGGSAVEVAAEKTPLWWSKNAAIDREITDRFAATVNAAAAGRLDAWRESPRGLLALIICADQFPRNIHRGAAAAFACDPLALRLAESGVDSGDDRLLAPIQRVFAYLPFEHSEALADQRRSLVLYQALADAAPAAERELFDGYLDFACRHHAIIARFGRFPHRNAVLARRSSAEELAFLEQPGSSF